MRDRRNSTYRRNLLSELGDAEGSAHPPCFGDRELRPARSGDRSSDSGRLCVGVVHSQGWRDLAGSPRPPGCHRQPGCQEPGRSGPSHPPPHVDQQLQGPDGRGAQLQDRHRHPQASGTLLLGPGFRARYTSIMQSLRHKKSDAPPPEEERGEILYRVCLGARQIADSRPDGAVVRARQQPPAHDYREIWRRLHRKWLERNSC